jgi:hypothetical protein
MASCASRMPTAAGQPARATRPPPRHRAATGRVPVIDSRMSTHRSIGTWWMTVRNTHQAWNPGPVGDGAARRRRSVRQVPRTAQALDPSCSSYWVVRAVAWGRPVTWWECLTPWVTDVLQVPAAAAPALRKQVLRVVGMRVPRQERPDAPGCLPGLRFFPPPRYGFGLGCFFPGRSSVRRHG